MSPVAFPFRVSLLAIIALVAALPIFAAGHDVAPPASGPVAYAVRDPLVATNGETFLTLWTTQVGAEGNFIYASVADGAGQRTATASHRLLPYPAELVDLTAVGAEYLVLWKSVSGLHSSIISGAGIALRDGPSISPSTTEFVDVQTNGSTLLFTYHTSGPLSWPTETRAQVIGMDGVAIGPPVLLGDQALQATAAAGDGYAAITTEANGTYFTGLNGNGQVVAAKRLIGATKSLQNVVAASNGHDILVVTLEMFIALSPDGTVLNTRSMEPVPGTESSLLWTGDSYLHISRKGYSAVAQRLDRLGMPIGAPVSLDAGVSSAAIRGGIVYAAGRTEDRGNVGFVLTSDNGLVNPAGDVVSITPAVQTAPVIASDGTGFLSGWTEESAHSHSFSVTQISSNAVPVDARPIALGPVEAPERVRSLSLDVAGSRHSIACDEQTCLAVWEDAYDIRGRWIIAGRADTPSFAIGRGHISGQALVWNGHDFFVAWNAGQMYATTVSLAGVVSGPTALTRWIADGTPPEVAWDGHHYLLMTTFDASICDCPGARSWVSFSLIGADGTLGVGDAFFANFLDAHLTASDHDFLVVYDHYDAAAYPHTEVATRQIVVTDTTVQIAPPAPLFRWFGPTSSSAIWNGESYVAAWRYGSGPAWWLTSARITPSGLSDRRAIPSGVPDRQVKPSMASNVAGESVIVVSESPSLGEPARLRAYTEGSLEDLPSLPAAPFGVYTTGTGSSLTVHWQSDGRDVAGFVVERAGGEVVTSVGSGVRSVVVSGVPSLVVLAFNARGVSGVGSVAIPRRRASG